MRLDGYVAVCEGITGAAVWSAIPTKQILKYKHLAEKETDPERKKMYLHKMKQWQNARVGGVAGGAIPIPLMGTLVGGPIGATVGYRRKVSD